MKYLVIIGLAFIAIAIAFYRDGYEKGRADAIRDTRHVLIEEFKDKIIIYKK